MREAVSDQAAQPVRNFIGNANMGAGLANWTTRTQSGNTATLDLVATGGPTGGPFARMTLTANGGSWWRVYNPSAVIISRGAQYTYRPWVRLNRAIAASVVARYYDGAQFLGETSYSITPGSVIPGVWQRFSLSVRYPNADRVNLEVGGNAGSTDSQVGDTLDIAMVMLHAGTDETAYGDGSFVGWRWVGTPHASDSVGYPWATQPVRNIAPYGTPSVATSTVGWSGNGTRSLVETGGPNGGAFIRATFADGQINGIYNGNTVASRAQITPGTPCSVLAWVRTSVPGVTLQLTAERIAAGVGNGTGEGNTFTRVTSVANTWQLVAVALPGRPLTAQVTASVYRVGGTWSAGDTLDVGFVGIYDSVTPPDVPSDGGTPGWAWDGAVNASTSRGLPYRLEDIAGDLLGDLAGAPASVDLTAVLGPLESRTTYVVVERRSVGALNASYTFAQTVLPAGDLSGFVRQDVGGDGLPRYTFRPQFVGGGGAGASYASLTSVGVLGVNILAIAQRDNLTAHDFDVNGISTARTGMLSGSGLSNAQMSTLSTNVTQESPIRMLAFRGAHSDPVRKRLTAWLARRHGGTIPAGY